jgi:murein DD-endopeptidase MepM/ murein hydrolase activator NlpD
MNRVVLSSDKDGFKTAKAEKKLEKFMVARHAKITTSISQDAQRAGIPYSIIGDFVKIFSWDIDFQRDIQKGDILELMYEVYTDESGKFVKSGGIVYANLLLSGRPVEAFRFEMADGSTEYFKRDGLSVRRTLMKTPIDGARVSSGYGMRRHPILGYSKMHKGVDFAAATGTPIYAAGDGVVEFAGTKGAYGKYVMIRHNSRLHTAYGHMSRIAKGLRSGMRVKQRQVIGYVGSTGRSTGPHLHYEVHVNRQQVNPRGLNLPTGIELAGKDRRKFQDVVSNLKKDLKIAYHNGNRIVAVGGGAAQTQEEGQQQASNR